VDVGDRVSAILNAAEEAARQIRADAERAAEATRREAEREAERYAGERRSEVDGEGERVLAGARADAEKMRETAHAAAQRVTEEGRRRLEELREEARTLGRRFESAIDELRDLVTQLEDVAPTASRRPGEEGREPEQSHPAGGADLTGALRPASGRAESPRKSDVSRVDAGRTHDGEQPPS
jgi:hypothetical protein